MNPADYHKVKEIFQSALEVSPVERAAYLDEKCPAQPEMRLEVERLLNSYESGYLEQPAVEAIAGEIAGDASGAPEQIGHYKILRKIGAGGMGEVYLAEDGKLGRRLAIKLLPETFTGDEDRLRRFEQEARTASALNHPNILTVFEIGDTGKTRYIATEYIDGETLRARLNRGSVSVNEALEIAIQCASALAAAHEHGIIHRDIKPENIMLRRDNLVKVLDFGLAKLLVSHGSLSGGAGAGVHEAPTEKHLQTAPGVIMGTVQYMSPEQTRGHATDARTDIWSLGCVMYEMLAGNPPFAGENTADLIAEIVKSYPASLSQSGSSVPERLDEIVAKTLEKNHDERYQTAKDLLIDLRRLKRKLDIETELERSPATRSGNAADVLDTGSYGNSPTRETVSSAEYLFSEIKGHKRVGVAALILLLAVLGASGYIAFTYWQASTNSTAARFSYASKIKLAAQAVETANLPLTKQLLDETKPQKGGEDLRGFEWGYLARRYAEQMASQPLIIPQEQPVGSVVFSPDGKSLATAGMDKKARLWNVSTGQQIGEFAGHEGWLVSVAFSPDGKRLATGAFDKTGRLWDLKSGQQLLTIPSETNVVGPLRFSADGQTLVGNAGETIKFWNATTGVERTVNFNTGEAHNPFALSADGKLFAARATNEDRSALIWDIASGRKLHQLRGHTGYLTHLEFSPDSKTIFSGSTDGTAKLWDLGTGKELLALKGHTDEVWTVVFTRDGKIAATGSKDRTIKLWDTAKGHEITTLRGHTDNVRGLAFSPDGLKLASGAENDETVRIWNVPQGEGRGVLRGHSKEIDLLTFSPDSKTIASESEDGTVKLWDVETERDRLTISGDKPAFSPDGLSLATAEEDGTIKVWDAVTGRNRLSFDSPKKANLLKFSPDEKLLASGHLFQDDLVRLWNTSDGTLACSGDAGGGVFTVDFINDGKQFVTTAKSIAIWETASCDRIFEFKGEPNADYFAFLEPTGKRLLAVQVIDERGLKLIDIQSGKELATFTGHEAKLAWGVDFSPNGKRLVTNDETGLMKMWDVETGQELISFRIKAGEANQIKFSPDGSVLATAGKDGTIRLWRAARLDE